MYNFNINYRMKLTSTMINNDMNKMTYLTGIIFYYIK